MLRLSHRLGGFRALKRSRTVAPLTPKLACEQLEQRTLLSFPPLPVVPGPGETQILQNALRFAQNQQLQPWDHQPIPFAVVGTNLTTGGHLGNTPEFQSSTPANNLYVFALPDRT